MNIQLASLASVLTTSIMTFASAYAGTSQTYPFLTRKVTSGFVAPDYRKVDTCEIYSDHVVVTKVFGSANPLTSVETLAVNVSGDFQSLLETAAHTPTITENPGIADIGSIDYTATWKNADTLTLVILRTDDGLTRVTNPSSAADLLINLIDGVCPSAF